ncbi:hypothetical protein ABTM47_19710, partial [Acinetobacter baumannii]
KALEKLKVNPELYSIESHLKNDVYVIEKINNQWYVYYSERGKKNSLRIFELESEACDFFLDYILEDSSAINYNIPLG